jgi:hypothetical protein
MNAKRWCLAQVMAALGWMPALCVLLYESSTGLNRGMTTPLWLHNELLQQQHVQDATTVHAKKKCCSHCHAAHMHALRALATCLLQLLGNDVLDGFSRQQTLSAQRGLAVVCTNEYHCWKTLNLRGGGPRWVQFAGGTTGVLCRRAHMQSTAQRRSIKRAGREALCRLALRRRQHTCSRVLSSWFWSTSSFRISTPSPSSSATCTSKAHTGVSLA